MNVAAITLEHPTTPVVYDGPVYEGPAARQSFSLPESVMYYIAKNPTTPELQEKLAKTCKWFYAVNPVVVCSYMHGSRLCGNEMCYGGISAYFCSVEETNLAQLRPKIWIKNGLHLNPYFTENTQQTLAAIIPKLYTTKIPEVQIKTPEPIAFKDAVCVISGAKKVRLDVKMLHVDGSVAAIEEVLGCFEEVEKIRLNCEIVKVTGASAKKMAQLKNLTKVKKMFFFDVPATMVLTDLLDFILKHRHSQQYYYFDNNINEEDGDKLNTVIDAVIADKGLMVIICYRGQDVDKIMLMSDQCAANINRLKVAQANV